MDYIYISHPVHWVEKIFIFNVLNIWSEGKTSITQNESFAQRARWYKATWKLDLLETNKTVLIHISL